MLLRKIKVWLCKDFFLLCGVLSNQYVSFGKFFVFDLVNTWFDITQNSTVFQKVVKVLREKIRVAKQESQNSSTCWYSDMNIFLQFCLFNLLYCLLHKYQKLEIAGETLGVIHTAFSPKNFMLS